MSYTGGKEQKQRFIKADWVLQQKVPLKLAFVIRIIMNKKKVVTSNALEQSLLFILCTSRLTSSLGKWGGVRSVGATVCLGLAAFEVSCSSVSFTCCLCLLFLGESAGWGMSFCVPTRGEGKSEMESSEVLWIWNKFHTFLIIHIWIKVHKSYLSKFK